MAKRKAAKAAKVRQSASPLDPFRGRELRFELPELAASNPGLAWIHREPETHESSDGEMLTVIGSNMAGLWLALAGDGTVHLVDDAERELGMKIFASVAALAAELGRQNP